MTFGGGWFDRFEPVSERGLALHSSATAPMSILILAAGASARMRGVDKLLEPVGDEALLRRVARIALGTGLGVTIALPPDRPARRQAVLDLGLALVTVADADQGMAASIRAGVANMPGGHAVMVLLADMPEIDGDDLRKMIGAYRQAPKQVYRAVSEDGAPGHPVVFPPMMRGALLGLQGNGGAKALLAAHADDVKSVKLPKNHAITDLDTQADWAAWRAGQTGLSG